VVVVIVVELAVVWVHYVLVANDDDQLRLLLVL
jgi:hypothetical protein